MLLLLLSACHRNIRPDGPEGTVVDPATERILSSGPIVGLAEPTGTYAWLGIPYAKPPVGDLRWRPPQPPEPWTKTLEASHFGRSCPQLENRLANPADEKRDGLQGGEDCLTLNVYAPQLKQGERVPVMVWFHGGGNSIGNTAIYGSVRNLAAKHKVVVVTVNYRLGVLGWFHHPALYGDGASAEERSGNYATLDLIRSLKWVQAEIEKFGGDPGNVTIFGESAGGMNVFSLLVSPAARGLFHRAISQSGLPTSYSMAQALNYADDAEPGDRHSSKELLLRLLVADGTASDRTKARAKLEAMSPDAIAQYLRKKSPAELMAHFNSPAFGMYFAPFILRDGAVLPAEPFLEVMKDPARVADVPVLLGTNRDEFKLFMAGSPRYIGKFLGFLPRIKDVAAYDRDAAYISAMWKVLGADLPAERLGRRVYAYRFDWDEAPKTWGVDVSKLLGAAHGLEIPILFMELDSKMFGTVYTEENRPGRQKLGEAMASYWANFAYTGEPGRGRDRTLPEWKPYDAEDGADRLMVLDTVEGGGVRMVPDRVQADALVQQLIDDRSYSAVEDRCVVFVQTFGLMLRTAAWTRADFHPVSQDACRSIPDSELEAMGER